ncbi:Zn-ribbon domain-containing OB-fold protein [Palaeococcus sp. (in: euryarchaeotes)]
MGRPMQVARYWRHFKEKYRMVGTKCKECGEIYFPPRQVCPKCGSREMEDVQLSGKGKVLSWTIVRNPPSGFEYFRPYPLALIELEEGPIVLAQLTDVDENQIDFGMEVEMVTRKIREFEEDGLILYGYKFRPPIKP